MYFLPTLLKSCSLTQFLSWIKEAFEKADRNQDGSVDFEECMKLLKKMNIKMDKSHAKVLFEVHSLLNGYMNEIQNRKLQMNLPSE